MSGVLLWMWRSSLERTMREDREAVVVLPARNWPQCTELSHGVGEHPLKSLFLRTGGEATR